MSKGRYRNRSKDLMPSKRMQAHIKWRLQPEDVFGKDAERYADKMMIVRRRIIGVFAHSTDPETKKGVFDNRLIGVGDRQSDLVSFMCKKIYSRNIVSYDDLPDRYSVLVESWRKIIIRNVAAKMIEREIDKMRDWGVLWPLASERGVQWQIAQSVADEWFLTDISLTFGYNSHRRFSEPKQIYRDERSYHGRPSLQSRRRNRELRQAPGISVGASK